MVHTNIRQIHLNVSNKIKLDNLRELIATKMKKELSNITNKRIENFDEEYSTSNSKISKSSFKVMKNMLMCCPVECTMHHTTLLDVTHFFKRVANIFSFMKFR